MSNQNAEFGGFFEIAGYGATQAGKQLAVVAIKFLDSAIGKIILTAVAGVITGGAGAAIVGPTLASLSYTLPAALIGDTHFLEDWTKDMFEYTNAPYVITVPGLSEAIGKDTKKAMEAIQNEMVPQNKREEIEMLPFKNADKAFLPEEEYNKWYRTETMRIIGNKKVTETPDQLAKRLKIREDAAAMAISVWNGDKRPDMSKYNPATGFPKTQYAGTTSLGGKGAIVTKNVSTQRATSAEKGSSAVAAFKASTMAAQTSQPRPPTSAVQPTPFYKTDIARKAAPVAAAGIGLGGALLAGLAAPIVGAIAIGAGGTTYLLTRKK